MSKFVPILLSYKSDQLIYVVQCFCLNATLRYAKGGDLKIMIFFALQLQQLHLTKGAWKCEVSHGAPPLEMGAKLRFRL